MSPLTLSQDPPRIAPRGAVPAGTQPMAFTILRSAHEAFRTGIRLQEQALKRGETLRVRAEWRAFQRACVVHVAMEERLFVLLDDLGAGTIAADDLAQEHADDERAATRVDAALAAANPAALYGAWTAWKAIQLRHLAHEEAILTPLVMATGATPEARGRFVQSRLITPSEQLPNFDWAVGWVVQQLSEYGSTAQPPEVAARIFACGLQSACSRSQWRRLRPVVQRHCTPGLWAGMVTRFGLDGEGAIA